VTGTDLAPIAGTTGGMLTALAADPTGGRLIAWARAADAAFELAQRLCATSIVPEAFRGRIDDATAAIMLGDELGLSPLAALRALYMPRSGVPAMYSRTMVALVVSRGHRVWTESESDDAVTVAGHRVGDPEHVERSTWTLARARSAGLLRNNVYRDHPQAMLYARAAGDVARRVAPDVLMGVPELTAEESGAPLMVAPGGGGPGDVGGSAPRVIQRAPWRSPPVDTPGASDGAEPPGQASPTPAPAATATDDHPTGEPDEPAPVEGGDIAEPVGEPLITDAQRKLMHAEFRAARLDRARYLAWVERIVERPVETTNDLTVTEASYVLDRIAQAKTARIEREAREAAEGAAGAGESP
jgi:hypothetical protein